MPAAFGIPGYVGPLAIITAGYALFQTANNTDIMADVARDQRGVISGMLNLSRNLGLVTGASAMGTVFALASGAASITTAPPEAVAIGMRTTFALAAALIILALLAAIGSRLIAGRSSLTPSASRRAGPDRGDRGRAPSR
jgi:hypothetical protein